MEKLSSPQLPPEIGNEPKEEEIIPHISGSPSHLLPLVGVVIVLLILIGVATLVKRGTVTLPGIPTPTPGVSQSEGQIWKPGEVETFKSESEFEDYLKKGQELSSFFGRLGNSVNSRDFVATSESAPPTISMDTQLGAPMPTSAGDNQVDRVSGTNVQVVGIDEPDILKTDGKQLYYSNKFGNVYWPAFRGMGMEGNSGSSAGVALPAVDVVEPQVAQERILIEPAPTQLIAPERALPPEQNTAATNILSALPPEAVSKIGEIDKVGDLLLSGNMLIVLANQHLYGFDVSDPASPVEKWNYQYGDNAHLVTARLKDGEIYLITSSYMGYGSPCEVQPLAGSANLVIPCTDIYHPIQPVPVNNTYAALKINPQTGQVTDKVAFVGSSHGQAVVYMSSESLYVTYGYTIDTGNLMMDFVLSEGRGIFSDEVIAKIEQLQTYDLSTQAKLTELTYLMENSVSGLDEDERLRIQQELENKGTEYFKRRQRDIERTGIVKISLDNLSVTSNGDIPGTPLNQFSLDEYEGSLRIATTINQNWMFGGSVDSVNDVYVLDDQLRLQGSIQGLGLTERIYSARFIGDRGYLVTFRQIDPFYILDLSDANNPKMTGELKIPGYSSYLHPIADNLILGIGKEGANVKVSMFDVSNAQNPEEVAKYILEDYSSEILETHHAFLHDPKHSIFFVPGNNGGYIFKYENNGRVLNLLKAVATNNPRRALFINDFLYVVGDEGLVVFNETNWEEVRRMSW